MRAIRWGCFFLGLGLGLSQIGCLEDGRPLEDYLRSRPDRGTAPPSQPPSQPGSQPGSQPPRVRQPPDDAPCSVGGGQAITLEFVNRHTTAVDLFWVDPDCRERPYGPIARGERKVQATFGGHVWRLRELGNRAWVMDTADIPVGTPAGSEIEVVIQ